VGRGYAWLSTGAQEALLEAGQFFATLEHRQGLKIGCPGEIVRRNGWISDAALKSLTEHRPTGSYRGHLSEPPNRDWHD
jgi:glucose-1-phosphate thymidylyltransferase